MQINLRVMMLAAILALSPGVTILTTAHPGKQGAATSASQQDKVKACNDVADKKGLVNALFS